MYIIIRTYKEIYFCAYIESPLKILCSIIFSLLGMELCSNSLPNRIFFFTPPCKQMPFSFFFSPISSQAFIYIYPQPQHCFSITPPLKRCFMGQKYFKVESIWFLPVFFWILENHLKIFHIQCSFFLCWQRKTKTKHTSLHVFPLIIWTR